MSDLILYVYDSPSKSAQVWTKIKDLLPRWTLICKIRVHETSNFCNHLNKVCGIPHIGEICYGYGYDLGYNKFEVLEVLELMTEDL